MKELRMKRVADNLYLIDPPVTLDENSRSRRLFSGEMTRDSAGAWHVRGTLIVERKSKEGWQQMEGVSVGALKAGDLTKIELPTEQVQRLYRGLQILVEAAETQGTSMRPAKVIVGKENEVVRIVKQQPNEVVKQLISQNRGADFWTVLGTLQPDVARQLADAELQRRRKHALEIFEDQIEKCTWTEPEWEKFFTHNTWIFGYGLRYQFLSILQNQANYGGGSFTRRGEQKGEFLMATEAQERFTVLVEIKRPDSHIFDPKGVLYRSGVPAFSAELINAISQVNVNTRTWEFEGSRREVDQEVLSRAGIHTINPRAILLFGKTGELKNLDQRRAFELFRANLLSPDLVTFDELLSRARFIVSEPAQLEND